MDIFLPGPGMEMSAFLASFDEEIWQRTTSTLDHAHVYLVMPRFELEYRVGPELDHVLQDLGMGVAYTNQADFSRMSPSNPRLTAVAHKTYIRVDEEGTEAAAVTGAMTAGSAPPSEILIDHPFVFTISDTETGVILFAGAILDPSAK